MKRTFISLCIGLLAMILLAGCAITFGGGRKETSSTTNTDQHPAVGQQTVAPTLGQQLIDLQKAKDAGAITDTEYQQQKAKLLESK
jgi:outer membrane biogenesis lipoprotein LolB